MAPLYLNYLLNMVIFSTYLSCNSGNSENSGPEQGIHTSCFDNALLASGSIVEGLKQHFNVFRMIKKSDGIEKPKACHQYSAFIKL